MRGKRVLLGIATTAIMIVVLSTQASAWGWPPPPLGCASWGEYVTSGGACTVNP